MGKYKFKIKEAEVGDVNLGSGKKTTVTDIDPITGKISWDVDEIPDLEGTFDVFVQLRQFLTDLSTSSKDKTITKVKNSVVKIFNEFRTHLRKTYPKEYKSFQLTEEELDEISTTGGGTASFTPGKGAQYATPYAFNKNKKAKGAASNYYYKLGYKRVPKKIKGSGIEVKQLFEAAQTSEEFQKERTDAFNTIESELNDIYKMLSNAKNETSDFYTENPGSYNVIKPTDLILDYIEDIKELLKGE